MESLVDTRHSDNSSQVIIALMEVDMNKNLELVYITPDLLVALSTLYKHIKIIIKTKGYTMIDTEPNLLITKAFTGQVANNSNIRCTLKPVQNVIEILASKGLQAFETEYYSTDLRAELEWDLDNLIDKGTLVLK